MDAKQLYTTWVDLWNGKFTDLNKAVSEDFIFHREHGQGDVVGAAALQQLIEGSRAAFSGLTFTTTHGPLADGDLVAGRNEAEGTYLGGMPGASAPKGTEVSLTGIDMLRVKDGKIVECWHNGNDLAFMLQLGAATMK